MSAAVTSNHLFRWCHSEEIERELDQAEARRLSRIAEQLSAVLTRLASDNPADRPPAMALEAVTTLGDESLFRVLGAPETHFRLTQGSEQSGDLVEYFSLVALAERTRHRRETRLGTSVWTALGDLYFPETAAGEQGQASAASPRWHEDLPYEAPRLGKATIVDFCSPFSYLPPQEPAAASPAEKGSSDLNEHEESAVLTKIREALAKIGCVSTLASMFVQKSIKTVAVKDDPSRPHIYRSMSSRAFVGKATLVNAQLTDITPARIADSLIHEAVHALLYEREQARRWVIDPQTDCRTIVSPWTGNLLRLDNFLHASFVWYALARFWTLAQASDHFPRTEMENLYRRAAGGFRAGAVEEIVKTHTHRMVSEVSDEILSLCQSVEPAF